MLRYLSWLTFLLLPSIALSQSPQGNYNPVFDKVNLERGLSSNNTNCIIQDNQGYIWIATTNGLCRYDGSNFKTYLHDPTDSTTISANAVRALFIDHKGIIWIGTTGGGLNSIDPQTDIISHYKHEKNNPYSLSHNEVLCIYEDSKQRLWVGTEGGINLFNRKSQSFISFTHDQEDSTSIGADAVLSILEDKNHNIWIGTWAGGLNLMNFHDVGKGKEAISFTRFQHDPDDPYSISSNNVWKIFEDKDGRIWLATFESGLNQWIPSRSNDPASGKLDYRAFKYKTSEQPADFHTLSIIDIEQDENDVIWLGTVQGIVYFNPENVPLYYEDLPNLQEEISFRSYRPSNTSIFDLPSDLIKDIFIGSDHIIWVSTNVGVSTYLSDKRFTPAYPDFSEFGDPDISSFAEENDSILWLGTLIGGLFEYNLNSGKSTRIENPTLTIDNFDLNKITALYKEGSYLWIGNGHGVSRMHIPTRRFNNYRFKDKEGNTLPGTVVRCFFRDSNENLWITTQNGLIQIDGEKHTVFKPDPTDSLAIPDNITMDVLEDINGNLWAATSGEGMCEIIWDKEKGRYSFKNYRIDLSGLTNVSSIINCVIRLDSYFLIGTTNGLILFDPETKTYFRDKELAPQIQGYINSLAMDQAGHLWISMDDGLLGFFPEDGRLASFDIIDGLPGDGIGYRSSFMNGSGKIYIGGLDGFCSFYGHTFSNENTSGDVIITDLKIYGESVKVGEDDDLLGRSILDTHISRTKDLTLSYQHKAIGLEFAMLDYTHHSKNTYHYMLKGFDEEWQELKGQNSVIWSHLKPGNYTFMVKVKNKEGFWSKTTTLPIYITSPIWRQEWFASLVIILLLISAWAIYDYRIKKIRSDRQKLQKLVEERTSSLEKATEVEKYARAEAEKARKEAENANNAKSMFLANMSHEIRTPLNGVLGMVQLLSDTELDEEQSEYIDTVQKSSESLLGVINDILDFSKIESGKMTLEAVSFNIRACLEEVAQLYVAKVLETQIRLVYSVDHRIPATIRADKIRLKQILSNLVSNALKFTQDGYVEIFIGLPAHVKEIPSDGSAFQMDIWVKDSGIGISEEKQRQLFNAFSQADNSITRKYGGTGLGLAICQKLSQLMGGDIEVSSVQGEGSNFHFWIQCNPGEDLVGPIYQSFSPHHGKVILTRFLNKTCSFSMYHTLKGLGFEPVQIQEPDDIPKDLENIYCVLIEYDYWMQEESHWRKWQASQSQRIPFLLGHTFGLPLSERTREFFDGLVSYPLAYKSFTQTLGNLKAERISSASFQTAPNSASLERDFALNYPLNIMVAEDNPVNQKLIKRVLEKLGYEIEIAANGKLALEMYKDIQPDLIFMDIQMPEMDGVTACKEIRKLNQFYKPPHIIAMTANAMKGDRETFLAAGMDDYIAKPFKIQEVKEVLKDHAINLKEKSSQENTQIP